jgi:hypothetical protein
MYIYNIYGKSTMIFLAFCVLLIFERCLDGIFGSASWGNKKNSQGSQVVYFCAQNQ